MSKESVLITALEKIIEMNRQNAEDQYGNADKAERWSCVTVAREAIKKYNTETKEPFIKEEPKDHIPDIGKMIGEDELFDMMCRRITDMCEHNSYCSRKECKWKGITLCKVTQNEAKECARIAKQYANSKLEELEKWVDENLKDNFFTNIEARVNTRAIKSKIQSLKQQ